MAIAFRDLKSCESVRNLLRKMRRDARAKASEARSARPALKSRAGAR